ncbi:hypothetical protein EVA_16834 [gut metagenome]|uniref:Uncharacterized protein n=1 Tax=gut metagenome TaxID=749906 RepID=J9C5F9_9ZZZZ
MYFLCLRCGKYRSTGYQQWGRSRGGTACPPAGIALPNVFLSRVAVLNALNFCTESRNFYTEIIINQR